MRFHTFNIVLGCILGSVGFVAGEPHCWWMLAIQAAATWSALAAKEGWIR